MTWEPDPLVQRFKMNLEDAERAHRQMVTTETHQVKFIRQRAENALGAVRVALACMKEFYPNDADTLMERGHEVYQDSIEAFTSLCDAYASLQSLWEGVVPRYMHDIEHGRITSEDLDELGIPK
jgi:hypothetical protein